MEGAHRADEPRDRGERLNDQSAWSGASYERIAESFAPIHARIVDELAPQPGERFLDLACGTGGVALIAARAGADVVGLDFSADQLGKARAAAEEAGLEIAYDEGNAQALPYADGEFAVVASCFGVIFAPDCERAGAELARVCASGGRTAVTAWPDDDWSKLGRRLRPEEFVDNRALEWSEPAAVESFLPGFDLTFERGVAATEAESADELWQLLSTSVPPLKAWLEKIGPERAAEARLEYDPILGDGRMERDYVLTLGTRR